MSIHSIVHFSSLVWLYGIELAKLRMFRSFENRNDVMEQEGRKEKGKKMVCLHGGRCLAVEGVVVVVVVFVGIFFLRGL